MQASVERLFKIFFEKFCSSKGYKLFRKTALETGNLRQSVISWPVWELDKAKKLLEAYL